ncbi:hypothetical protein HDC30_002323 [Pseudomonas sp. JAI115]|uniref:hypothetical protein n=1 Tax=Pseudomonas sp. JAI115 TaxID=2723061 RepID=UPI00160E2169|nr:hypothetical protein [Pseudomonas sp. JAI115]MBB6155100.1 hypothetical protein [Pseudomonas sp. JAI115]
MGTGTQNKGDKQPLGIERFFRLGLIIGDDSRELAVKLIHLIRGHGIYKVKPSKDDKSNNIRFLGAVHDGWKLAQNLIIEKLIHNLREIEALEKEKIRLHQLRLPTEKANTLKTIRKLKLENLIFRRFVDSIVWGILDNEHSTIRRLPIKNTGDNLSIKNIEDARPTIDEYNECPLTIAILSDITTFVHHGDIVKRSPSGVVFIELKSGKKGTSITRTAQIVQNLNCAIANEILTRNFDNKDKQQLKRTKNQIERNNNLSSTLRSNLGKDSLTGLNLKIEETKVTPTFYISELMDCRKRLEENGNYAITVIDNCLYVGMYKTLEMAYVGFNSWMSMIECKSEIYNLTDSFHDALSRPLVSLDMPTEFVIEIFKGDVIMVACLDIEKFLDLSNSIYPSMITLTTPPRRVNVENIHIKGKALTMSMGDKFGIGYLGGGLLTRMAYDLQKPSSILQMQYAKSNHFYYIPPTTQ